MPRELKRVALIADDDEFFRLALAAILTAELGFVEVVQTASLDEAIEKLSARKGISLALFDLAMPGMKSPANLRAVRDCFPGLCVAVVSASRDRRDILSALEAGVHGYVPKGLGALELSQALRQIVDGVIYVPPSIATLPQGQDTPVSRKEDAPAKVSLAILTPRQRSVLDLLVQGKSNKEIARSLTLGEGTVKVHMAALFRNLRVRTRTAAAVAGGQLLLSTS